MGKTALVAGEGRDEPTMARSCNWPGPGERAAITPYSWSKSNPWRPTVGPLGGDKGQHQERAVRLGFRAHLSGGRWACS